MSKIYNEPLCDIIPKHKFIRQQRRFETFAKKQTRMKNAQNDIYDFTSGYYIEDTKTIGTKVIVTVPEKEIDIGYWVRMPVSDENAGSGSGDVLTFVKTGIQIIPEHQERRRTGFNEVPIQPILRRKDSSKKHLKKFAARRTRYGDVCLNGSYYKKQYDISWMLW